MPTVVRFDGPRAASLVQEPRRPLSADQVRLRTLYSGISAGTELTAYRGSNPYLAKQWDAPRRLFLDAAATFEYPHRGLGLRGDRRGRRVGRRRPRRDCR